jgi:hypothetical protein
MAELHSKVVEKIGCKVNDEIGDCLSKKSVPELMEHAKMEMFDECNLVGNV